MNAVEFFTIPELKGFSEIAGQTYRRNENSEARDTIKQGVWRKTQYWSEQLKQQLGKTYKVDFKMIWSQRGWENGQRVSAFKKYTWARIYKPQHANKDIYFTIGVDGLSQRLIVKLDYQRTGKSILSEHQAQICRRLLRPDDDLERYWISISLTDLQEKVNSWDVLLEKSIESIRNFESVYEDVIKQVWPNEIRLARIVYNTTSWLCQSGRYGKSENPDNHEAQYGYGYEEWLLDFGKLIDGFHYGFLEPVRTSTDAYQGQTFDVWLYTIHSVTKERFWVGNIRNMQVLLPQQVEAAWAYYDQKGWLDEMRGQINHAVPSEYDFSNYVGSAIFNVRFKPEDSTIYPQPIKVDADSPVLGYRRYTFIRAQSVILPEVSQDQQFKFTPGEHDWIEGTTSYDRQAKTIILERQHRDLSHYLYQHLVSLYGEKNVGTEQRTRYNTAVDVILRNGKNLCFYEIKTYPSLKQCIREAVGQLLEYSYWPTGRLANELIIVTSLPADQETRSYMNNLRALLNLPIWYQQFDLLKMELGDKV